uniref:Uncharacterized protein n=1 Tax=Alexandrium andersonii TaxID=327968 RepID=A0A7S2D9Z1_9DINO|mmetsp:Transcript_49870/g.112947  ORF Transcript_49870/g.112947 Transcript_49870/m.112947 type:complete len:154 (+) Transcript_49870:3-464(+)
MTGQSAPPGEGPPRSVRENLWVKYILIAEAEDGKWATCYYDGGEPYEVTSMCAACGALTMLNEPEKVNGQQYGGFVTPSFAFAESGFEDLLTKNTWACAPKGSKVSWSLRDGQAEHQEIMDHFKEKTQKYTMVTMAMREPGSDKAWGLPDYAK